jgi:hypothetical protein
VDHSIKRNAALAGAALILCIGLAVAAVRGSSVPSRADAAVDNGRTNHPVHIRMPIDTPRVFTGETNLQGTRVTVACSTCHATTKPNPATHTGDELDEFHQGLQFMHGDVSCLSCHNAGNYDELRLANGIGLQFKNVMQLCAQCHGPQYRDYRNGSHGGMNGYWDLKEGPRTRNNCVDCHDPHAPAYPSMMPIFKPVEPKRGSKNNKH